MRRLDELLQDIPLDELTGASAQNEAKTKSRRRAKGSVRVKSVTAAVASAAVMALAVIIAIAAATRYKTAIPPASENGEAEPITSAQTESTAAASSVYRDHISSSGLTNAHKLYLAMLLALAEGKADTGSSDAAELYVTLDSDSGENSSLGAELEKTVGEELTGTAYFAFRNGRLLYSEWSGADGGRAELFPITAGREYVAALGEKPN